jgi:hypothetical protein
MNAIRAETAVGVPEGTELILIKLFWPTETEPCV